MNFASDNSAPAHPKILQALEAANYGAAPSYGADMWTARAEALLREVFERDCAIFLVPTGTAANALALAAMCPPWGAVICHEHAHIARDEAGAPEFYTGGAKLLTVPGPHAKLTAEALAEEAGRWSRAWVHGAQPFVAAITQASECGASLTAGETAALSSECRRFGLKLFMDGARFANAAAFTRQSPADLTWRAGVDAVAFGATKNGALACEALIVFDEAAARALPHLRKRAGHLFSKHRLLSAQMCSYLADGLWLSLAAHANAMAARLAAAFTARGLTIVHPVEANAVFVRLPEPIAAALKAKGAVFYPWTADGADVYRFVTSWATAAEEVAALEEALGGAMADRA
jgi:threonine aldolase